MVLHGQKYLNFTSTLHLAPTHKLTVNIEHPWVLQLAGWQVGVLGPAFEEPPCVRPPWRPAQHALALVTLLIHTHHLQKYKKSLEFFLFSDTIGLSIDKKITILTSRRYWYGILKNLHLLFYNFLCTTDFENAKDYFFAGQLLFMGQFNGYFEGAKTFLTPKLSRALETSLEMVHKVK